MKTAISIPDELFNSAENTAKRLGIPRSQLFAQALEEFIKNHSKEKITEKLNNIYSDKVENSLNEISVSKLRDSLKNDSW
jgi:metal-responsive CopG/Arc/MetJ family transcriptional regulator